MAKTPQRKSQTETPEQKLTPTEERRMISMILDKYYRAEIREFTARIIAERSKAKVEETEETEGE